ncbi:MAG: hypothetical protein V4546_14970, partial [Bacteroidota bacterium]
QNQFKNFDSVTEISDFYNAEPVEAPLISLRDQPRRASAQTDIIRNFKDYSAKLNKEFPVYLFKQGFFLKMNGFFHSCCSPAIAYSPRYAALHFGLFGAIGFIKQRVGFYRGGDGYVIAFGELSYFWCYHLKFMLLFAGCQISL